jgi:hypothetical protein
MDNLLSYRNSNADSNKAQTQTALDSNIAVINNDSVLVIPDSALVDKDSIYYFGQNQVASDTTHAGIQSNNKLDFTQLKPWDGLTMNPREKNYPGKDWLTGILFFSFVLLVSVKAGSSKYIGSLFQSLFNYPTSFRMFREKNYTIFHGAYRLEALYYIVLSVFIFQVIVLISGDNQLFNALFFGKTLVAVVAYFMAKKLAYRALGSIFIGANDTNELLFNMDNFNRGAGIVLFPVVALIAYYPFENIMFMVFLGVLTTTFFYLMLLKRGISILLKKQFPLFYLFLYLCTLEFLPLLLIYKIVVD